VFAMVADARHADFEAVVAGRLHVDAGALVWIEAALDGRSHFLRDVVGRQAIGIDLIGQDRTAQLVDAGGRLQAKLPVKERSGRDQDDGYQYDEYLDARPHDYSFFSSASLPRIW